MCWPFAGRAAARPRSLTKAHLAAAMKARAAAVPAKGIAAVIRSSAIPARTALPRRCRTRSETGKSLLTSLRAERSNPALRAVARTNKPSPSGRALHKNPPDPRHPGESRDPSPTACVERTLDRLARTAKGRRWIPAFAGMTFEKKGIFVQSPPGGRRIIFRRRRDFSWIPAFAGMTWFISAGPRIRARLSAQSPYV
jgi:hypothetical protein